MNIISKNEALAQGLKRYFTGRPCYRGHIAERLISNRKCLECHAEDMFIRQVGNRDHARNISKKSRLNRPWHTLKNLKENMDPEKWNTKLAYMRVKNQERRDYSIGKLSLNIKETLYSKQNGLCNGCFKQLEQYHIDHIVPLVRGGANTDDNVQLLCATCNLSKGSKTMKEWKGD